MALRQLAALPDLGVYQVVRILAGHGASLLDTLDVLEGHLRFFGLVPDMRKDHVTLFDGFGGIEVVEGECVSVEQPHDEAEGD